MAFFTDCAACAAGNHAGHNEVIWQNQHDGNFCRCPGDCAERQKRREERENELQERKKAAALADARALLEAAGYEVRPPSQTAAKSAKSPAGRLA